MRATVAEINSSNLINNINVIKQKAPNSEVMAIVKANAYGHGLIEIAGILEKSGVNYFGVAYPEEGILLRDAGFRQPILVLVSPLAEEAGLYHEYNLQAIADSIYVLKAISDAAYSARKKVPTHLFINTGMNREGIKPGKAVKFMHDAIELPGIDMVGICTHFAASDADDTWFLKEQLSIFNSTIADLSSFSKRFRYIHAANSGAVFSSPESHFNLIRPGISIYGYDVTYGGRYNKGLKKAMSITSKIAGVKNIDRGETVGYSRRFVADKPMKIGLVPIGYGDGLHFTNTNNAEFLIDGRFYPVVGSVCMDQCMIDLGGEEILPGAKVTILGEDGGNSIDAFQIAKRNSTIPYEILTSVSERVPRLYI